MKNIKSLLIISFSLLFSFSYAAPSIDSFLNNVEFQGNLLTPDEQHILLQSNQTGDFCQHSLDLSNGRLNLVSCDPHSPLAYFPNGDLFISTYSSDGSLQWGIESSEGEPKRLDLFPDGEGFISFLGLNETGKKILFLSGADFPVVDVWEMDIETKEQKRLFAGDEGVDFWKIRYSKDFRYLAVTKYIGDHDSELILVDTVEKTRRVLNLPTQKANHIPMKFSSDHQHLYYLSDAHSEFLQVRRYDLTTGQDQLVVQRPGDIDTAFLSPDEAYLVAFSNEEARHRLVIYSLKQNRIVAMPSVPRGTMGGPISITDKKVSFYLSSPTQGKNLYLYEFESGNLQQLTHSLNSDLNSDTLVEAEHIFYPAKDGQLIPALFYKPRTAHQKLVPALIWAHGGPTGQTMHYYDERIQILLQQGYAVLAPNPRGSTGYGKTFAASVDHYHGNRDLDDYLAGKQFLIASGIVDEKKIGIAGESYGGYIALAALTYRSEEMVLGIDFCGPADWILALKTIPLSFNYKKEHIYKQIGHPDQDAEYLKSISPLFSTEKIKKPLFVIQGEQDHATVPDHAKQLLSALKERIPLTFLLFRDEGHSIMRKKNRKVVHEEMLKFLDRHFL